MAKFWTSDHHFGDDRFEVFHRPFSSVEEQENFLVDSWNSIVGPNDEVYYLGDFATTDKGLEVVRKLNGKIHLIMGNYDDLRDIDKLNELFASVKSSHTLKLKNGKTAVLNHYPNRASKYEFNIVGHVHGLWKVQRNMINVSCDAWHFLPVSEDQIIFTLNQIENYYDDNAFAGELEQNIIKTDGLEIYASESIPKMGHKIFLAGPTPRLLDVKSWRPKMIKTLRNNGYTGHILIPEKRNPEEGYDYNNQIKWEEKALEAADIILFWVPRNLITMPGFTTNIEFGEHMKSGKVILGYPNSAEGMKYMNKKAIKYKIPVFHNMDECCEFIIKTDL